MPGLKAKYSVDLTNQEEQMLRQYGKNCPRWCRIGVRARILLTAYDHPDWNNQYIAHKIGCTDRTVRKWRRRWTLKRSIQDLSRPGARSHLRSSLNSIIINWSNPECEK